jgi:hypothetical protein
MQVEVVLVLRTKRLLEEPEVVVSVVVLHHNIINTE